jgi:cytochrome b involved in lipid metabolism
MISSREASAAPSTESGITAATGTIQNTDTADTDTSDVPADIEDTSTVTTYTAADVAAHADVSSCWSIIDGNVYDLSSWISQHPGGEQAILSLCGKDGSAIFHGQHGDAQKQADILATMKIGVFAQ